MLIQSPGSVKDNFRGFSKEELNTTNEKMEHVKRLLSTAATGTGIVGDLDATMQQLATPTSHSRKPERNLWRLEEVKEMLSIMQETNALDLLNDKMVKSESVFYDIEKMMIRRGYNKKSHNQIWTKWKFLKSTYMTSRRNDVIPKMIPGEIYLILHKMLGNGSELVYTLEDNSNAASFDGDQSMIDEEIDISPLSHTNGREKGNALNDGKNVAKPDAFGMAHPIFGFRLGMVKSEPADTGYDTTANNSVISENDSLENSAVYPVGLSPQNSQDNSIGIKAESAERVTASPLRPKTVAARTPTPESENSLLVPRETAAMSIRPLAVKQKFTPARVTSSTPTPAALRIAPFAKETNLEASLTPSPPLRTTELATTNDGSMFSVSPAISLPSAATRGSILRLPRDVTLQLRSNYAQPSGPLYPAKATASANAKHYATAPLQQEQPMTSQMAKVRANLLKKRRLEIPNWEPTNAQQPTAKMPRFSYPPANVTNSSYHTNNNKPKQAVAAAVQYDDDDDDDDVEDTYNDFHNDAHNSYIGAQHNYRPPSFQRAYEQQYSTAMPTPKVSKTQPPPATAAPTSPPPPPLHTKSAKNRAPMEEILKDMAMSLRQSQLQMVNDFFEQQMELARKEHEFQMEQDRLLMAAFKKQTQQLMKVAQELFNTGASGGVGGDSGGGGGAGTSSGNSAIFNVKNKANERRSNTQVSNKPKNTNTHASFDQTPSQQIELSSSDSDVEENEDNGDSDPLLSALDPTQFVSSELVDTNDENEEEEEESLV